MRSPPPTSTSPGVHPEGAIHEIPAPPEMRQHGVDPAVVTRDCVTAGDVPMDIVCEQRPDRRVVTAGVESLLGLVEPSQQSDGSGSIHDLADEGA
jgi:hypothetical protein